jgi:Protein of unknown function (DUF1501)
MTDSSPSRRDFLSRAGQTGLALGLGLPGTGPALAAREEYPKGKAESCLFLWLGGGACHIDTFDPKRRGDGKKKPGSAYNSIPTAIQGAKVCEHLSRTAPLLDRAVLVRALHHDVVDEHAAATNRLHTGRPTSGTIVYPSLGAVVSHELGGREARVPAYVVMGYPNVTRGPGFLGSKYGYLYLTETDIGPNGLVRPADVSDRRQKRREALLARLREDYLQHRKGDEAVENYAAVGVEGLRLAGPQFMKVFDLKSEPASLRESYGGEFGQRCLLARRLVQSGVRFVEVSFNLNFVNGTGWDTHNEGQKKQHELIEQLDRGLSSLLLDLEKHRLLEKTLVVVATEFGRPPEFDAGGGRGHHSKAFSAFLAGGGLRPGKVIGVTDDLGKKIVEHPVSVPDLHATIYCALGINPAKNLYTPGTRRPVPITDEGKPITALFGG